MTVGETVSPGSIWIYGSLLLIITMIVIIIMDYASLETYSVRAGRPVFCCCCRSQRQKQQQNCRSQMEIGNWQWDQIPIYVLQLQLQPLCSYINVHPVGVYAMLPRLTPVKTLTSINKMSFLSQTLLRMVQKLFLTCCRKCIVFFNYLVEKLALLIITHQSFKHQHEELLKDIKHSTFERASNFCLDFIDISSTEVNIIC